MIKRLFESVLRHGILSKQQQLTSTTTRYSALSFKEINYPSYSIKINNRRLSFFTIIMTPPNSTTNNNLIVENLDKQSNKRPADTFTDVDTLLNDEENNETFLELERSYLSAREECSSKWLDFDKTCYIYLFRGGGEPATNLAAFDLDGTLIRPKSNKRIPKNATDWELFSVWTKVKLQQAIRENAARFVIFTNQNGVGLRLVALEEVQERIELVTRRLNIPCTVFVAIDKDEFRKPNVGMFRLFEKSFNDSMEIDYEKSFYCGDAIGYPSHSDADLKFAQTLKLPFLAPDKFLRGVKPKLILPPEQQKTANLER